MSSDLPAPGRPPVTIDVEKRPLPRRILQIAVVITELVGVGMLISLFAVVMIEILDRFFLHLGFSWPEELSRFLLIWLAFLSAALAVVSRSHYVLDFIYRSLLEDVGQHVLGRVIANAVSLIVVCVLLASSLELATRVSCQSAPALQISMIWVYAAAPIGFGLILLFYAVDTLEAVTGGERQKAN